MTYKSHAKKIKGEMMMRAAAGMTSLCASIVREAQENANATPPNHPQVQSGTLRRSITMDVKQEGKDIVGYVGIMKGHGEGDEALMYAPFIEFGTSRMPAYPFLFPAVESHRGRIKEIL